jgi:hypothetical protein
MNECSRFMSDYDISLVNDSMQEFIVRFQGPSESESPSQIPCRQR